MIEVTLQERSNPEAAKRELDRALKEFRRAVIGAGIFDELRKRRHFRSPGELKKYKREVTNKKRARRRQRRLAQKRAAAEG